MSEHEFLSSVKFDLSKVVSWESLIESATFWSLIWVRRWSAQSLFTSCSFPLNIVVFLSRPSLFLKPLPRKVGVSAQSPVVVIVYGKGVHIPADEEENAIDKASVKHVCTLDSQKLHAIEHSIELRAPLCRLWQRRFSTFISISSFFRVHYFLLTIIILVVKVLL